MRYPAALVRELGRAGVARFDEVTWQGEVVAAMLTLKARDHWMCWLAAQSDEGRSVAASYLAYDNVLRDAHDAVPLVNLGLSAPGTGGAEFKRRLGAVERPMYQWETSDWIRAANDARKRALRRFRAN
jgi:hypothetical protein